MNVGIFTFPNSISYGAVLQMYALYHTVENLGHTPEVINYQNSYMKHEQHFRKRSWLRRNAVKLLHHKKYHKFHLFEQAYLSIRPSKVLSDPQRLPELAKRYNAVICGSDQVWNPDITDSDLSYFLNFCDGKTKRVAYAPSFGHSEFSDVFLPAIRAELEKFKALSVREEPGQALISDLLGKNVPLVCDPTLLMDSHEWEQLEKPHAAAEGAYVLYFTVKSSATLWAQCKAFAKEKGLKIVVVGGNPLKQWKHRNENIQYAVDIGPEEWLYLIHHARYIFTNSFHGTAFSINYRKDFYVELPSFANSRLIQIMQIFGLSSRILDEHVPNGTAVDYSVTTQVLPQIRRASMDYLSEALK